MDPRSRDILQIDLILEHLAGRAASALGRGFVAALMPAEDMRGLQRRQAPLRDLMALIHDGEPLALGGLSDIRPQLKKARIEGAVLDPEEWPPAFRFLQILATLEDFYEQHQQDYPALCRLLSAFEDHDELRAAAERTFDEDGRVADHASPELGRIRRALKNAERQLLRTVERLARDYFERGLLQDNYATVSGGRHVLPVKASSKGRVKGVLHGSSGTGETTFIEPLEFLDASNEIEGLRDEERHEIYRILAALTAQLRPLAGLLDANHDELAEVDGLQSIARLAVEKGWALPLMSEDGAVRLFEAHHPLLQLELGKGSVPVTMLLDPPDRGIIFSGPNAGGKTTAMKTVACLSFLAQSGCPIPAFPDSTLPLFSNILADIGDQQDLQAGLSTFSGHITRIRDLLRHAGHRSLVILDELGTGTDPQEGTALALALLEEFRRRCRLTLTTSHLNPVKQWAEDTEGVRNASFSLDPTSRAPTFKLRLDLPGASEALEIAAREGLPREVLDRARSIVGEKHLEMGEMLRRIEERERRLATAMRDAEARAKTLEEQEEVLRARAELLREERKELRAKVAREREAAAREVREKLERLIAELPSEEELAARRAALAKARDAARHEQQFSAAERRRLAEAEAEKSEVFVGQRVFVRSLAQWGDVTELRPGRDQARVLVGNIEANVKLSDLLDYDPREKRAAQIALSEDQALTPLERRRQKRKKGRSVREALKEAEEYSGPSGKVKVTLAGGSLGNYTRPTGMTLDLHGYRVEEALAETDKFLDRALLANYPYVKICHGTGTGRLYRAIHDYLRTHPAPKKFRFGNPDEGGGGVTVVEF